MRQSAEPRETEEVAPLDDLVHVLHHALKEQQACARTQHQLERTGDTTLASFFARAAEVNRDLALEARRLLHAHLADLQAAEGPAGAGPSRRGGSIGIRSDGQDAVQQASEESFPASDAPAY